MHGNRPTEIRLRMDELDRRLEALGYMSDSAKAAFLGLSPSTFSRLRNGQQRPGNSVIARVLSRFPKLRYEHLFEDVAA